MHELLAWAIVVISSVFIGLTLLIVSNKAWRENNESYHRRRRHLFEPAVLAYAHGDAPSLLPALGAVRPRDMPVLEETLIDHVQRVRGIEHKRLARALSELGFVDRHLSGLHSRRWWQRARSAERLGLAGATNAIDALSDALKDEVPEVRLRAAKSLGILGGPSSVRVLIGTLEQPDRWSTIRIADVLTSMGHEVVDDLVAAFPRLGVPGRLAVLDVIGRLRPLPAGPFLVEQTTASQRDVRARACHALGCIGDPDTADALIAALSDAQWPVRAMAAKALGRVRDRRAVSPLCEALADRRWWVRSNAAYALRAIGPAGIEALEGMLGAEDRFARHQALLMLQESGDLDRRMADLVSEDAERRDAARAIVRLVARSKKSSYLRELSGSHPDPEVREALSRAREPGGADAS
jgi:HEAT repeat protein